MSAANPQPNRIASGKLSPLHTPATFADANALLQIAIQQLPPAVRSEIILRCDSLPRLKISEEALQKAFTQILHLIVDERGDTTLFLHITCLEEKERESETKLVALSRFLIQFHANVTPQAPWMQEADTRINNIASLLLPFGGSLLVNQLKNSGCVFVIALPGK